MGLTAHSVGIKAVDSGLVIKKQTQEDKVVALAGNPNVGKSTVFNALTGMNQHTGNWPGKTVANAQGYCSTGKQSYVMVDKMCIRDRAYLGLESVRTRPAQNLSGGMKRKLMIAKAMIHNPQYLFLDEPTVGIDPNARRDIWEFLRARHKELSLIHI